MIGHYSSMTLRHPSKVPWTQGVLIVSCHHLTTVACSLSDILCASPDMLAKNSWYVS